MIPNHHQTSAVMQAFTICMLLVLACSCSHGRSWFVKSEVLDKFKLQTAAAEMSVPIEFTSFTSDEFYGRLSPDGEWLIYAGNQKGNVDIWLMDLTTGIPKRLTRHVAIDTMPSFSPDGKSIIFISRRDDVKGDLYIMDIDGDNKQRLSDRETADAYPLFTSDGKSVVFASGPEGNSRIVTYDFENEKTRKLSGDHSTQPALSADGKYLSYVQRNSAGTNELVLLRMKDRKIKRLPFGGYHCGFPSFSPDGKDLFFVVFYHTKPDSSLTGNENGSIWKVSLDLALGAPKGSLIRIAEQITSGRNNRLFLQAHESGLLSTTNVRGNLDIDMIPFSGLIPNLENAERQLAFADDLQNDRDRLLGYRKLRQFPMCEQLQQAYYRASQIDFKLGWYDKQLRNLEKLDGLKETLGDWQGLARVDKAVWKAESTSGQQVETGTRLEMAQVDQALENLDSTLADYPDNARIMAYGMLKTGDMQRLRGNDIAAIRTYEKAISEFAEERETGIQARIRLGEVYGALRATDLQVSYYMTLFEQFPEYEHWLRLSIENIVDEKRKAIERDPEIKLLLEPPQFDSDRRRIRKSIIEASVAKGRRLVNERLVSDLRVLIDAYPQHALLGAVMQYRIGKAYEHLGHLDLAIKAMKEIASKYSEIQPEATEATFALGDYSLELSRILRADGHFNEAGATYSDALGYFERIAEAYPPTSVEHRRARKQFISLAMLKAAQEENEGDIVLAKKSYRRILEFDSKILQAHRKLIQFDIKMGKRDKLFERYEKILDNEESRFIGHYCLGYLHTWADDLNKGDLSDAEDHLERAIALNPSSPYPYLTLGWINEMRERALGNISKGWLEIAIKYYETAYALNDRNWDLQTEADILLNRGNVFSLLGNTWRYAYDFYHERLNLNLPFNNKSREALFKLHFGRAAFNLDKNEEASEYFEHALLLAKELGEAGLQAELIARLALNYQSQGKYDISSRYFEESIKEYRESGDMKPLAALTRSIALNHFYAGELAMAASKLDESRKLLEKHGTRAPPDDLTMFGIGSGLSLYPMGFDKSMEAEVNLSLRNLIFESMREYPEADDRLLQRYEKYHNRYVEDGSENAEMRRELALINRRRAKLASSVHNDESAITLNKLAYLYHETNQSGEHNPDAPEFRNASEREKAARLAETEKGEMSYVFNADDFKAQVVAATESGELLLKQLAEDKPYMSELLPEITTRLQRVADRLDIFWEDNENPPMREDLIWRMRNSLALLSLKYAMQISNTSSTPGLPAEATMLLLARQQHFLGNAIGQLKRIIKDTAPPEDVENMPEPTEMSAGSYFRIRTQATAFLNLAEVSEFFSTDAEQIEHESRGIRYLDQALQLCEKYRMDDICLYAEIKRASISGKHDEAKSILDRYLSISPLLLGHRYLQQPGVFRHRIFSEIYDLAISNGDFEELWRLLELESSRQVVDEIAGSDPGVDSSEILALLSAYKSKARSFDERLESQSFFETEKQNLARKTDLEKLAKKAENDLLSLAAKVPRLTGLFKVLPISPKQIIDLLDKEQALLTLAPANGKLHMFLLDKSGIRHKTSKASLKKLREVLFQVSKEDRSSNRVHLLSKLFGNEIKDLLAGLELVYLDIDRLDPRFPIHALLSDLDLGKLDIVRVASAAGLNQSFINRNIYRENLLATFLGNREESPHLARSITDLAKNRKDATLLRNQELTLARTLPELSRNSTLLFGQPLTFSGHSAANAWLRFIDDKEGFGHFRIADHLDSYWKANIALFIDTRHTADARSERLLLERMLGAFGLPGFIIVEQSRFTSAAVSIWLDKTGNDWQTKSRARAYSEGLAATLKQIPIISGDGIMLYGHAGMNERQMKQYAETSLMPTIKKAIGLQKANSPRAAVEEYERALKFIDFLGDEKLLDKVLEMIVLQAFKIGDFDRVVKYQLRVLARAQAVYEKDKSKIVNVLNAKKSLADYYVRAHEFDKALAANQEILDTLLSAKRKKLCGPYYSQRGLILEMASRYRDALASYEIAFQIYSGNGDIKGLLLEARNASRILRQRLSRYRKAKSYITQALRHGAKAKDYDRLLLRLGLARNEQALGNYQTAVDINRDLIDESKTLADGAFAKAMKIVKNNSLPKDKKTAQLKELKSLKDQMDQIWVLAHIELANTLWIQGDYAQVMKVQQAGMQWAKKTANIRYQIRFNTVKGITYANLGNMEMAVATARENIDLAQSIGEMDEVATANNNLGDAYRKWGRFAEARKAFNEAMEIDRKLGYKSGLAFDYANLGLNFESMGRKDDALDNFKQALVICREIGEPRIEVKVLLGLGRTFLQANDFEQSRLYLKQGIELSEKLNLADWEWKFRLQFGRLLDRERKTEEALAMFMTGIDAIEPMPSSVRSARSGPKLEEEKSELYDEALSILARMGRSEEAFDLSERFRSRKFLDLIGGARFEFSKPEAAKLLAEEYELTKEIRTLKDIFMKAENDAKSDAEAKLEDARKRYDGLIARLAEVDRELPAYVNMQSLSYTELKGLIPPDISILSYYQSHDSMMIWILTATGLEMKVLPFDRDELRSMVSEFLRLAENLHPMKDVASNLYGLLIGPVEESLKDTSRLVIVAHDFLHFLPFAALFDGKRYIIDDKTISYLSSVNQLRYLKKEKDENKTSTSRMAIGFDPPSPETGMGKLPFTRNEIESFGHQYPDSTVLMQDRATESKFKRQAPEIGWIPIAAHTEIDKVNPFATSIVLAGDNEEDGRIHLHEVLAMGLDADLVSLSTCQSAIGPLGGGDEIIGLNRAFLSSGARQVLSSLWRVSDLSTAILMKHVFRYKSSLSTAEALQKAQMEVKRRYPHPAFWSGFKLEGQIDSLKSISE